jgi:uncharacterized protein YjiS (DUF1127 family)
MPPQQTNLTSETGPDAAVALGRSLPEKAAAWPQAASARNVLSLLKRYWRAFGERRRYRTVRIALRELSDRQLTDIGLTGPEIDCIAAHRAFERLREGMTDLWMRS